MDRTQEIPSLFTAYKQTSATLDELQERIQQISAEAMDHGSDMEKRLLVQNIVAINSGRREAFLDLGSDKGQTIMGNISQFTGETQSSACTSIAQRFLRQVLSLRRAQDFQHDQIDGIVRNGKSNFKLLLNNAQQIAKELGIPLNQSFSHPDSAMIYDLGTVVKRRKKCCSARKIPRLNFLRTNSDC